MPRTFDPCRNRCTEKRIFVKVNWNDSILKKEEKTRMEHTSDGYPLVKYRSIFATQRLHFGNNTDFRVKLTPQHNKLVYPQSLSSSPSLKDDLLVELALVQEYGIMTNLLLTKYSSPIFAQRNRSGKLRNLVELRRINHLIKRDYRKQNHPVSTISDAAKYMARKKHFWKLDCSKAYHCIQMADEQSVQLFSFTFGSKALA